MLFQNNFTTELSLIITDLKNNKTLDALNKFKIYLNNITSIKNYSAENWPIEWRQTVYEFGKTFIKCDASLFLEALREKINQDLENSEIFEFIKQEVVWNFYQEVPEFIKFDFKKILSKYKNNPEFLNNYSNYLIKQKSYKQSLEVMSLAIKIEPSNPFFYSTNFNIQKKYFDELVLNKKFDEARNLVLTLRDSLRSDDFNYKNLTVGWLDRLEDRISIDNKIESMNDSVLKYAEKERGRFIEVLSLFSAILAFILVNTNIAIQNLTLKDKLTLMAGMAIILSIFAFLNSLLFSKKNRLLKEYLSDFRVYFVVMLVISFIVLLIKNSY